MSFFRVYVDESGGRGTTSGSDDYFVMSAVIVHDSWDAKVRAQLVQLKAALGLPPGSVLHFQKLSHGRRLKVAQDIPGFNIAVITSTIICKKMLATKQMPTGAPPYISRRDPMYLWAMRLTLERVSWYCEAQGAKHVKVTFSHLKGFKPVKLLAYRSALERTPDVKINWALFPRRRNFSMEGPAALELLQVADSTASATYQAVQPDQWGNTHPVYLQQLLPKVFRGHPAPITSYGLKVFPAKCAGSGADLNWLQSL